MIAKTKQLPDEAAARRAALQDMQSSGYSIGVFFMGLKKPNLHAIQTILNAEPGKKKICPTLRYYDALPIAQLRLGIN